MVAVVPANPTWNRKKTAWMSPSDEDQPGLDETARKLGFPGMLQLGEESVINAWLQGNAEQVQAQSDLAALNTYLLALRIFAMTGEMNSQDVIRVSKKLRAELTDRSLSHLDGFLSAWSDA